MEQTQSWTFMPLTGSGVGLSATWGPWQMARAKEPSSVVKHLKWTQKFNSSFKISLFVTDTLSLIMLLVSAACPCPPPGFRGSEGTLSCIIWSLLPLPLSWWGRPSQQTYPALPYSLPLEEGCFLPHLPLWRGNPLYFSTCPVYTMKYSPSLFPTENFKHSLGPVPIIGIWGFISE